MSSPQEEILRGKMNFRGHLQVDKARERRGMKVTLNENSKSQEDSQVHSCYKNIVKCG